LSEVDDREAPVLLRDEQIEELLSWRPACGCKTAFN
jgi:hypothetical protein